MGLEKPTYYAILTAKVRYDPLLLPMEKLLHAEITALSNRFGYCWATNQYFAELYKVSQRSISRWINNLVALGHLESKITYKDGTKEIDQRRLRILDSIPMASHVHTPVDPDGVDNTTSYLILQDKEKLY